MKNGFLAGLVIAAILIAGAVLAPGLLRSQEERNALAAQRLAEQARREMTGYIPALSVLALRADLASLKDADFDKLTESANAQLVDLAKDARDAVQKAEAAARKAHLSSKGLALPNGFRGAVLEVEKLVRENEALLKKASSDAQSALNSGRSVLGVAHVAGMVKLVEAHARWAEALRSRSELAALQRSALALAGQWSLNRAEADHYHGLDPTKINADLTADLKEMQQLAGAAAGEVDELQKQVGERRTALEQTRAELKKARIDQLALEEAGFALGNDQSLATYRQKYEAASQLVGKLQEREQLLANGGNEGGRIADDDLLDGALEGGTVSEGLERLEARLAEAQVRAGRLANGVKTIEQRMAELESMGRESRESEQRYAKAGERIQEEFKKVQQSMEAVAKQAFELEDQALAGARAASDAFRSAKSAADAWTSQAGRQKNELDVAGKNERLKKLASDRITSAFSDSAEGEAKALVGRIHAERLAAISEYATNLERLTRAVQGSTFDAAALQTIIETARTEAVTALGEARTIYARVIKSDTPAKWAQQISLGTVDYLLSKIDTVNSQQHQADAIDNLRQGINKREKLPYMSADVLLLANQLGASAPAESGDSTSQPGPAPSGG